MATFQERAPSISDEKFVGQVQILSAWVVAACSLGILGILLVAAIFAT
jgi:hypothetical protein